MENSREIPLSDVSCFSGKRSVDACRMTGSPRPFELQENTAAWYCTPASKFVTLKRATGDDKLFRSSWVWLSLTYKNKNIKLHTWAIKSEYFMIKHRTTIKFHMLMLLLSLSLEVQRQCCYVLSSQNIFGLYLVQCDCLTTAYIVCSNGSSIGWIVFRVSSLLLLSLL